MRQVSIFVIVALVLSLELMAAPAYANRCLVAMGGKPAEGEVAKPAACPGGGCPFSGAGARTALSAAGPGGKRYLELLSRDLARLTAEFHFDKFPFPQTNMTRIGERDQFAVDTDPDFLENHQAREALYIDGRTGKYVPQTTQEPGVSEASREILDILAAELPVHHPETYRRIGDDLVNLKTGSKWNVVSPQGNPLATAGRLVTEDLILVKTRADGEHYMEGGFLITPTMWSLNTWMGSNMTAIHDGISSDAKKNEKLLRTINGMLTKLDSGVILRNNWHVTDDATFAQPDYHKLGRLIEEVTVENAGDKLFVRIERQTIRRLPKSGFALFTIKIYTYPLRDVARDPVVAKRLINGLNLYVTGEGRVFSDYHDIVVEYLTKAAGPIAP